ncbi:MEKHLA domain-containing protein [Cupriavidus sp. DF5525]|uniref:MEKHLA domain-containing protein n=1 Tax=Cupriavidus sp. DF5525 TaxID=3160989 RepID=UPI0035A8255B
MALPCPTPPMTAWPRSTREERQQFLARVQRLGYEAGYKGVRITKSGQRFMIEEATLWQLLNADGKQHGQAVVIPRTRNI